VIVVTGSTGRVGGLVARELARRGEPMRLLVRDPARAPHPDGAEVVVADYGDTQSLEAALHEGDRVFMVSLWIGGPIRLNLHRSFVEAATRAGVGHVVYLSFVNARPDAVFSHAREHGATERMLQDSGLPWTAIRNSMYADDIPGWFDPDGVAREPGNGARMSFSYRPELAEAIAAVLTEGGHDGNVYDVTTPESVSMADLARIASEVTGAPYRYEPISDEEWIERWRAQSRPGWALEAGRTSYEALRAGELDVVSDDYRRLTGRQPKTIADVIALKADEMPLAAADEAPNRR
jgi:NAD(P)H dehydrogenase (quinone)